MSEQNAGRYGDASLDGYGNADIDQPQPRQPLDTAAIAAWNAAQARARRHYQRHMHYLETRKKQ